MITLQIIITAHGHELTGYDCEGVTGIMDVQIQNSCKDKANGVPIVEQDLTLLQYNEVRTTEGYSCVKIVSTFDLYCGTWSHQKFAAIPKIEINEELTKSECKQMIGRQKYPNGNGQTIKLDIDGETIIYSTPIGEFGEKNHNIECEGQSVKIKGRVVEEVVEMQQVKIILRRVKLRWKGDIGESQTDHVTFPRHCHIGEEGCVTGMKTYIWEMPSKLCQLERIREVQGRMEGNIFTDTKALIRLQVGPPFQASYLGCEELELYKTQYPQLFVIRTADLETTVSKLTETGIDMEEYINARDDFLAAELERKIDQVNQNQGTNDCERDLEGFQKQDEIRKIGAQEGVFGRMRGEVISLMNCKKVIVPPKELEGKCYLELPVEYKGKTYFLEPITRRVKKYGTEQPCEAMMASRFKTNMDAWITLTPQLHEVPIPKNIPLLTQNITRHIDMSVGGIYTHQQIKKWELATAFPDYHTAMTRRITSRACEEEGCSQTHVDRLGQVKDLLQGEGLRWSWWQEIIDGLRAIGQITSIFVAMFWIGQLMIRLFLCGQICAADGAKPACGLCGLFFTKDHLLVKEYHEMKKDKQQENEEEMVVLRA